MKPIRRMPAAIDFSEYSRDTVDCAAHRAEKFNVEMVVVNAINREVFTCL